MTFSKFSDKVVETVMCYLADDDRFLLREVNKSFYNSYYSQTVDNFNVLFNFGRAIRLAMESRVFQSVEVLRIRSEEVPSNAMSNITTISFPILKCIRVGTGAEGTQWVKPKVIVKFFHRCLKELKVHLDGEFPDSVSIGARFTELKKVKIIFRVSTLFTLPSSHKNLEDIYLTNYRLGDNDDISKMRFPMLQTVNGIARKIKEQLLSAKPSSVGGSMHEVKVYGGVLQTPSPSE